jgi:chaperonin GroEL
MHYDDPYIMVTDYKLDSVEPILPVLEIVAREGKPLIIVAEEVEGQALAALIMNAARGTLKIAAIKAPRYGEERRNIMKDLAVSVGATFVNRASGLKLKDVKLENFGKAKSIDSTNVFTTIVGGTGDHEEIDKRIQSLKEELNRTDNINECERLQERVTRLASGVAVIRVGGVTEIEMTERKHRVEDALEAVTSARLEGVVPGGGVALVRTSTDLEVEVENDEQRMGVEIVVRAAKEPLRQMSKNAGESPDLITKLVQEQKENYGFDFRAREVVDMYEAGIIDPVKVTKTALANAVSVAGTLITTNYAIIQTK